MDLKVKVKRSWNTTNIHMNKEASKKCMEGIEAIEGIEACFMLKHSYTIAISTMFNRVDVISKVKEYIKKMHE